MNFKCKINKVVVNNDHYFIELAFYDSLGLLVHNVQISKTRFYIFLQELSMFLTHSKRFIEIYLGNDKFNNVHYMRVRRLPNGMLHISFRIFRFDNPANSIIKYEFEVTKEFFFLDFIQRIINMINDPEDKNLYFIWDYIVDFLDENRNKTIQTP